MAKRMKDPVKLLASCMKAQGITQAQLGALVGLAQSQVSRILARKAVPPLYSMYQIEERFGIPARAWYSVQKEIRGR